MATKRKVFDMRWTGVKSSGITKRHWMVECLDQKRNSVESILPGVDLMPTIFEDYFESEKFNLNADSTVMAKELDSELRSFTDESDLECMSKKAEYHLTFVFAESDVRVRQDEWNIEDTDPEDSYWLSAERTLTRGKRILLSKEEPHWIYSKFSYDPIMSCENPLCTTQQEAKRMCHHPECVESSANNKCLLLCQECDTNIHRQPGFSGHLVLDLPLSLQSEFLKTPSEREDASDIEVPAPDYEVEEVAEEEQVEEEHVEEERVVRLGFTKNNSSTRSSGIEKRLRRKDAVKRKSSSVEAKDRTRSKSLSAVEIQSDVRLLVPAQFQYTEQTVPDLGHRHLSLPGTPGNGFLQVFLEPTEESVKITALKGKSIQELLSPQLEHHKIDISSVNIYLESSHTPLPMNSDAGYLEGTNLFVKAKDGSPEVSPLSNTLKEKDNKRIPSIQSRGGTYKVIGPCKLLHHDKERPSEVISKTRRTNNLSVDDSTLTPKGGRPLFITNKQKDKEKLDTMLEVLKNAVTQQPPATIFELEQSWRNIVANSSELPKEVQSQQEVIWELLYTESAYIESLKVITNLFMCCLRNVQDKLPTIMKEIECEKLFSNIVDVINANSIFWKNYLSRMLQVSRETKQPLDPSLMKEGFKKFPELFYPYQRFCAEQLVCQNYIKEKLKSNEYFKNFVTWAEGNTNLCRRLRLIDIIITPMQRLTRYALLLRRIKEKSTIEEQKNDLQEMIQTVDAFVSYVNLVVGQRREHEKLSAMASRIDSYEAVEAPNDECVKYLQHYNAKFNLMSPMPGCGPEQNRIMMHHANLKYKDATTRLDVECYIFTDLFLICKSKKVNERLKVLKPPIRINYVSVKELKDKGSILVIQLNEYNTPQMAFTLQAESSVIKAWLEKYYQAKQMYTVALHAASIHRQQLNVENEESDGMIETVPKNSQMNFPLFHGRAEKTMDPCLSPKLSNKDRPAALAPLQKQRQRDNIPEQSVSPMIVCQSPSPEHQSLSLLNTEMKTSHSVCSNLTWNNGAISEELKSKVDRNRKTEKRYFTADSIQELKRQESGDNSIHKRFSWNLGSAKNDSKQILSKHMSSDSIPSSSGVSSTGSSHLGPDHESNENEETTEAETTTTTLETRASNNSLSLNTDSRSKSMSDIALLLQDVTPSEMKDGISSVDLPDEINYSGLTAAQILNIKKYLLLNTTNESEV